MNIIAIVFFFVGFCFSSTVQNEDSVKLTVFYESYCSDSVKFVVNQLYPTWVDLKESIQLELVPFGFAKQRYEDGHFEFLCQHGAKECLGNTLHACALHQACGSKGSLGCPTNNLTRALDYIRCVMAERDQWDATEECTSGTGLEPRAVTSCAASDLGEMLESAYGNTTTTYNATTTTVIDYIPFIVVNNIHTKEEQKEAEEDLKSLVCKYIPHKCISTTATARVVSVT